MYTCAPTQASLSVSAAICEPRVPFLAHRTISLWAEGAFPRYVQEPLIPTEPLCEDNVLPSDTWTAGFHIKGGFIDMVNSPAPKSPEEGTAGG